ncbi:hypothetical protein ScPMuIL_015097 [Solemya velum]
MAENVKVAVRQKVFDDLGNGVLDNAWNGYNCSLFAYGQTGSGKSYSMVGYGANKGIVPLFCDKLFMGIEEKRTAAGKDEEYQVTLSMLEIYNEQVRDLLNSKSLQQKGGLKVRQHPSKGFYVESLITCPVTSYREIDNKINEGTRNRTVAATNMNATSSRAHTIVAITFTQKTPNESGQNMTRTSVVNLVDLAGSERAESTGATGDRLKEGSAINQSLSTLGNCIKALADLSNGKKKTVVPFRDSVLTKLLQNALGGNSKTIMIAALSPADINYEETLSTLRFADRAKAIKTTAVVNESPTDRLIRELREENARLMEMIKKGALPPEMLQQMTGGLPQGEDETKKQLEEELRKNQEEMENMKKSWEERLKEAQQDNKATMDAENKEVHDRKVIPHLWNLNEDPALAAMIVHFCKTGKSRIGTKNASPPADIQLNGLAIQKDHAVINNKDGNVNLKPLEGAKILLNGQKIITETQLHHNDRVLFGPNHLFVFHHPQDEAKQAKKGIKSEAPTYDSAQEEIAKKAGLMGLEQGEGTSREDLLLQEDLILMLPMVNEANAMSEELDKKVKFDIALVSPQARGVRDGRTEVMVKMKNLGNGNEWMWDRNKFTNRKFLMQEMYQNFIDGDDDWDLPQDKDPFWEPADIPQLIGTVQCILQSLSYNIDLQEKLVITDYKGNQQGMLSIEIDPCDSKWDKVKEDDFVEYPEEQVGKPVFFKLKIVNALGIPNNMDKTYCQFKFYLDDNTEKTAEVSGMNPEFGFEKKFTYKPATKQFIEYLTSSTLVIEVWGRQKGDGLKSGSTVGSTKEMMAKDKPPAKKAAAAAVINPPKANVPVQPPPVNNNKMTDELNSYKKRTQVAEKKVQSVENLIQSKKKSGQASISLSELENILNGGSVSGGTSSQACVLQ